MPNDYYDINSLSEIKIPYSPHLVNISSPDIADLISKGGKPTLPLNLAEVLYHRQAVERNVKL